MSLPSSFRRQDGCRNCVHSRPKPIAGPPDGEVICVYGLPGEEPIEPAEDWTVWRVEFKAWTGWDRDVPEYGICDNYVKREDTDAA